MRYVEKYCRVGWDTGDNMAHAHGIRDKSTNKLSGFVILM